MFKKFEKETRQFERKRNGKKYSYNRTRTIAHLVCDNCGAEFTKHAGDRIDFKRCNNDHSHYCNDCPAHALASAKGRETMYKNRSKLIGTKSVTSHGYIKVYVQDSHPYSKRYCGSILEHVLVMENYLKRAVEKNEVVHHIDTNKKNNDINNLDIMTATEHNKCHGAAANALLTQLFNEDIIEYDRQSKRYIRKK